MNKRNTRPRWPRLTAARLLAFLLVLSFPLTQVLVGPGAVTPAQAAITYKGTIDLTYATATNSTADYTIAGTSTPATFTGTAFQPANRTLTFTSAANGLAYNIVQTGTLTSNPASKQGTSAFSTITVPNGVTMTLVISAIDFAGSIYVAAGGNLTLLLDGANTIRTHIDVPVNATITINSLDGSDTAGSLSIPSVDNATNQFASIGGSAGSAGTITINGGTITIVARSAGAGIGGGGSNSSVTPGDGGTITINGGNVSVTQYGYGGTNIGGGIGGAGIGGGGANSGGSNAGSSGGNITIAGGTVTVTQYTNAAGIGAGVFGATGAIAITGGTVTSTMVQKVQTSGGSGAAIGSGSGTSNRHTNPATNTIAISGGKVTATGAYSGPGIGGVNDGLVMAITITGGDVYAKAGTSTIQTAPVAGIGFFSAAAGDSITITGGTVTGSSATGPGIGAGGGSPDFCLGPDATVTAYSAVAGFPAFKVPNNSCAGYYVNAKLNTALTPTTVAMTLEVFAEGSLFRTLTLPAGYLNFGYSSNLTQSRTDNVLVYNGTTPTGTIVQNNSTASPEIYSIITLYDYDTDITATADKGIGVLPVKFEGVVLGEPSVTDVGSSTATFHSTGQLVPSGVNFTSAGFIYSTSSAVDGAGRFTVAPVPLQWPGYTPNEVVWPVSGLTPETLYYVQTWITTNLGTMYSAAVPFTTTKHIDVIDLSATTTSGNGYQVTGLTPGADEYVTRYPASDGQITAPVGVLTFGPSYTIPAVTQTVLFTDLVGTDLKAPVVVNSDGTGNLTLVTNFPVPDPKVPGTMVRFQGGGIPAAVEFTIPSVKAGTYKITLGAGTETPPGAAFQMSINGQNIGSPITFAAINTYYADINPGTVTFPTDATDVKIRFSRTNTGILYLYDLVLTKDAVAMPGADGNIYRLVQSGVTTNPVDATEPKYGTSIFSDIVVQTGINVTLIVESIDLIGHITLQGNAHVTLLLATDTTYYKGPPSVGSFVHGSVLAPGSSPDATSLTIDSAILSGSPDGSLTVDATATDPDAAAIGGGLNQSSGAITIAGGTLTIQAQDGAGIGGGNGGDGNVTVTGGTLTVQAQDGAGIGGGSGGNGSVTVTGGTLTATGRGGAGVGSGHGGSGAAISIGAAATVKAYSAYADPATGSRPAIDAASGNAGSAYYVNAAMDAPLSDTAPVDLLVFPGGYTGVNGVGKPGDAIDTVTLPFDTVGYRAFAYTTGGSSRTDNLYADLGTNATLGRTEYRVVDRVADQAQQVPSVATLTAYDAVNPVAAAGTGVLQLELRLPAMAGVPSASNIGKYEADLTSTGHTVNGQAFDSGDFVYAPTVDAQGRPDPATAVTLPWGLTTFDPNLVTRNTLTDADPNNLAPELVPNTRYYAITTLTVQADLYLDAAPGTETLESTDVAEFVTLPSIVSADVAGDTASPAQADVSAVFEGGHEALTVTIYWSTSAIDPGDPASWSAYSSETLDAGNSDVSSTGFTTAVIGGLAPNQIYNILVVSANDTGYDYAELTYTAPDAYTFSFTKVNEAGVAMEGVSFTLATCVDTGDGSGDPGTADIVCDPATALSAVSDANGLVEFPWLTSGLYLLTETATLPGYQLPLGQWSITIDTAAATPLSIVAQSSNPMALPPAFRNGSGAQAGQLLLPNYPQTVIPLLGGAGTIPWIVAGIVLVGCAIAYATASRKATTSLPRRALYEPIGRRGIV